MPLGAFDSPKNYLRITIRMDQFHCEGNGCIITKASLWFELSLNFFQTARFCAGKVSSLKCPGRLSTVYSSPVWTGMLVKRMWIILKRLMSSCRLCICHSSGSQVGVGQWENTKTKSHFNTSQRDSTVLKHLCFFIYSSNKCLIQFIT